MSAPAAVNRQMARPDQRGAYLAAQARRRQRALGEAIKERIDRSLVGPARCPWASGRSSAPGRTRPRPARDMQGGRDDGWRRTPAWRCLTGIEWEFGCYGSTAVNSAPPLSE